MSKVSVKFKRTNPHAMIPTYGSEEAAGCDLFACEDGSIKPMERVLIKCGFAMELPIGYEAQVRPRSGLALKKGLTVLNSPGTIDSDYRGEVCVMLINLGNEEVLFSIGDRIAQMVIAPVVRAGFSVADSLGETDRGEGGFGSTGSN